MHKMWLAAWGWNSMQLHFSQAPSVPPVAARPALARCRLLTGCSPGSAGARSTWSLTKTNPIVIGKKSRKAVEIWVKFAQRTGYRTALTPLQVWGWRWGQTKGLPKR
jgi:hypothetical protein